MQTPREILADLWTSAGGDIAALDAVTLTGDEPQLPSSFRVAAAAQTSIAAAGLAAAQIWKLRSGQSQDVAVDMRHAVVECRSERYLRVDGKPPPPAWDVIAGIYKTRDQRFVRLHTNFRHHRDAVCKVLDCKPARDDVQAALMQWDAEAFETAVYAARRRGRDDALASRMVWRCRMPQRWPRCRRFRSRKSARPSQNHGPRVTARSQACACSTCRA